MGRGVMGTQTAQPPVLPPLPGYAGFVLDRVARGRMTPTALSRAAALYRQASPPERQVLSGPGVPQQRRLATGPLRVAPCTLAEANLFVACHHRHLPPVVGHKASLAVTDDSGFIRGVVILSRPRARYLDDGRTLEVVRCCTDGVRNGPSKLYGAARRWARRQGYRQLVTYTLSAESGASLRAAGWRRDGVTAGGRWSRNARPRTDRHPLDAKHRWVMQALA